MPEHDDITGEADPPELSDESINALLRELGLTRGAPRVRRAGISRAVLEKAHQWAVAEGTDSIELNIWEFNQGPSNSTRRSAMKPPVGT
jgi:hypothetical protein